MDLSVFDDLLNIAEIFSVFLGFTVLVTALSRSRLNTIRVMGVVIGASMGIVLCLLPILLRTFWEDANSIVQISSVVWITINASATFAMFKFIPGMKDIHSEALWVQSWCGP